MAIDRRDHPRTRGEHPAHDVVDDPGSGSPPHARGAPVHARHLGLDAGITPARAGSTPRTRRRGSPTGDHPRTRGEHTAGNVDVTCAPGSPPHARGARDQRFTRGVNDGITPARAGSTSCTGMTGSMSEDHPRTRGEHSASTSAPRVSPGSPPHARGALPVRPVAGRRGGITPARAGSTQAVGRCCSSARDHPRTRGEHQRDATTLRCQKGSPPHARGAQVPGRPVPPRSGITPARAGSTFTDPGEPPHQRDHPRTRGEHPGVVAWAGGAGDHPRTRGEHPLGRLANTRKVGSPPHARGARAPTALS